MDIINNICGSITTNYEHQQKWKVFFLINIKKKVNQAIPFLRIYSKELKAGTQTDTYALMFIAALFTTFKRWK